MNLVQTDSEDASPEIQIVKEEGIIEVKTTKLNQVGYFYVLLSACLKGTDYCRVSPQ